MIVIGFSSLFIIILLFKFYPDLFYNLLLHLYGINRNIKNNLITPTYNFAMNIHNKFQNDKNIIIVCGTKNYTVSINEILNFHNRNINLIFEKIFIDNKYYYKRHNSLTKLKNEYGDNYKISKPFMFIDIQYNKTPTHLGTDLEKYFIVDNILLDHKFMIWFIKENTKNSCCGCVIEEYKIEIISNETTVDTIIHNPIDTNNKSITLLDNSYSIKTI